MINQDILNCPKCNEKFIEINGLYVRCKCGYINDSTFDQLVADGMNLLAGD